MKVRINYTLNIPIESYHMLIRYADVLGYAIKIEDNGRSAVQQLLRDHGQNVLMEARDYDDQRIKDEAETTQQEHS